jgi:ribosome-binding protein aMBF1 (putative translation factor)
VSVTAEKSIDVATDFTYKVTSEFLMQDRGSPTPVPSSIDFAGLVRLLRQAKGLTQEEFARELEVTVGTFSGWEAGRHRPVRAQRKRLLQMAEASGIEPPPAAASGHQ